MSMQKVKSLDDIPSESKYDRLSYRQKGSEIKGALHKGPTINAYTKRNIGTIPSKYETVLYPQGSPSGKGFGSNTYRFNSSNIDSPGPGSYVDPKKTSVASLRLSCDSYSKKGYGNGFISKNDRFRIDNYLPYQTPGPGSYKFLKLNGNTIQKVEGDSFEIGSISENYKRKNSPVFTKDIIQNKIKINELAPVPGPGLYNIPRTLANSQDYKNTACFKFQGNRFDAEKEKIPGPGDYETDVKEIHKQLFGNVLSEAGKEATHNFKLPIGAKRVKVNLYDPFENVETDEKLTPGPGQYAVEHNTMVYKALEYAKAGPSCVFSKHEGDRFGKSNDSIKVEGSIPGPGQYIGHSEMILDDGSAQRTRTMVFKSAAKRISYIKDKPGPGPAFYKYKVELVKSTKNNNPSKEWI